MYMGSDHCFEKNVDWDWGWMGVGGVLLRNGRAGGRMRGAVMVLGGTVNS